MRIGPRQRLARTALLARTAALAVGCLATGGGCFSRAPLLVDFSPPSQAYKGSDYHDVYERWTRHATILHDADTVLEVWATFKSDEFREAFVAHYAEAYQLETAERERLRQTQREAATVSYDFVVTAQSNNYRWNDMEKKNSPWRVSLLDGAGHALSPDELTIERLPDLFEEEFYPAKTPFSKTYSIRFTRPVGHDETFVGERSGSITLRMAGPFGHLDLRWQARS
jgi:hypothetical protein